MPKKISLEEEKTMDTLEGTFDEESVPDAEDEEVELGIDTGELELEADVEEIVSEKELDADEAESEAPGEDKNDTELVIPQRTRRNRRTVEDERARQLAAEQSAIANESALRSAIRSNRVFTEKSQISKIQIDHVVALSDAWQKGAQYMEKEVRYNIATDPLNLLAVDGPANEQKSDGDAATWLPSNKKFRCQYVARQVSVKYKYGLWVTEAEKTAISNVLTNCPKEPAIGV